MHLRRLALVVSSSAYLLLQPSCKVEAVIVETAEECASIYVDAADNLSTSTATSPLKQVFYPPKQTTVTNFIATCIGSTELPEITDNDGYPLPSIDRFSADDCGRYITTNSCCMIDPSPGELFCNFSRYARCNLYHSPEDPYQITCKEGILRVLTPSSETLVLEDAEKDGYYMHFSGYDTPVMEQPDGSLRFSPKADDGSTRVIVARPWDLIEYADTCHDDIAKDLPDHLYFCMGVSPPPVPDPSPDQEPEPEPEPEPAPHPKSEPDEPGLPAPKPEPTLSGLCKRSQDNTQVYDTYADLCLAQMLVDTPQCYIAPYCHGNLGICLMHECKDQFTLHNCNALPYCEWIADDEDETPATPSLPNGGGGSIKTPDSTDDKEAFPQQPTVQDNQGSSCSHIQYIFSFAVTTTMSFVVGILL